MTCLGLVGFLECHSLLASKKGLWLRERIILPNRVAAVAPVQRRGRRMRYAPAERLLRLTRPLAATRTGRSPNEMAVELFMGDVTCAAAQRCTLVQPSDATQ